MFIEICLAAVFCFFVMIIVWAAKGILLASVRPRENEPEIFAVIDCRKSEDGLEQTVRRLNWLKDTGWADIHIIILKEGLSPEGRRLAELLTQERGEILPINKLSEKIGEEDWKTSGIT